MRRVEPLLIHADPVQARSGQSKGLSSRAITGVFHSHTVARVEQQQGAQTDRLLRAIGDDNLRRVADQATAIAQVGGDQRAQARVASGIGIPQAGQRRFAPEVRLQPRPDLEGKQVEGADTQTKCPWRSDMRGG
ncbi:hypothetical protein FQZ97_838960 [compost metagenome]